MNTYLLRRLFPFYIFAVAAEFVFTVYSMIAVDAALDLSFLGVVKTFGILLLTTTAAFLVVMIPYVLYLLVLPQKWQNSKGDKWISYLFYLLFVMGTLSEELVSAYFWQTENMPASLAAFRHSYNEPGMMLSGFFTSSAVVWLCLGGVAAVALVMYYTARFTLTKVLAPKWFNRFFQTAVYAVVCFMTYKNITVDTLTVSANEVNNVLSEEGTYLVLKETVDDYAGTDFTKD